MPLNYLSSSNAKDLDVMNVSKDLAELWFIIKELGSRRPSLRPPRRRRLFTSAISWGGAMTIVQVSYIDQHVPVLTSLLFPGTLRLCLSTTSRDPTPRTWM